MPLFVVLNKGYMLNDELIKKINLQLKSQYSPRHVPDDVFEVTEIPYTISGKKMETPLKRILMGAPVNKAANTGTMKNPLALEQYVKFL